MDAWLYTGTAWLLHEKNAPHVARDAWTVKFEPTVVPRYADADLDQAVKIVGVSDDHALAAKCEADMATALGRVDIHCVQMNALITDSMDRKARGVWS